MKLIDISIRRRVTIAMFTVAVLLFGMVSFSRLKVNLLPDLTYPTLTVRTNYTGAAPAEVENLITKPVEESLGVVKNVQQVRSISRSGQSDVILEFGWGTDMDLASMDVREKLDALMLPLDVTRPVVLRFDPSLDPIMRLGLLFDADTSDSAGAEAGGFDEDELKYLRRFADEEIKEELESALGVAAIKVSGGLEDEIQVLVDQGRLAKLNYPIERIASLLGAENVNLSGGRLAEGTQQYLVRTLNQFQSVEEIGDVILSSENNMPVYLRDVAVVHHGYKEREAISRIDGQEAVEIAIYKEGDANTVAVAKEVVKRLKRTREMLGSEMKLVTIYDQSTFISQAVREVINAGMIGGFLAIIILFLFLKNIWATLIISASIPVSVVATFNLMYGADLTLNIMSLGGIALGIGMLLDNSIVVLENISRHREMGKDILKAANDGASEVSMAVIASTMTTVAVFFPLVFVKGIAGQLFRDQALTVTFALLASLAVAITLIPMLASIGKNGRETTVAAELLEPKTKFGRGLRWTRLLLFTRIPIFTIRWLRKGLGVLVRITTFLINPLVKYFNQGYVALADRYPSALRWALGNKLTVLATAVILFAGSLALVPLIGTELIPQLSQGEFNIEFRMPPGTPLEQTDKIIRRIQTSAREVENIKTTFSVSGTGNRMDANPEEGGENWGEIVVTMDDYSAMGGQERIVSVLRKDLEQVPDLQYKFAQPTLFTFRTPVEVEVAGYDLKKLKTISSEIARRLEANERFADVKSTMESGHPEIQIYFDRERAAALGLPVYQVAERIVNKVRGEVATRYSWRDRKIDVLVRARDEDRNSVELIKNMIVNPDSERPVPLTAVADIVVETGPGEIRRTGQERVAQVTANLRFGDLNTAAEEINAILASIDVPPEIGLRLAGQNEEMNIAFKSLQFALLLAVFLVYLVMASQFESLLHPFVILFTIPLALIGAIWALYLSGSTLSVVVFIGLILLAGIVVNNAIVLIDLINQLRRSGKEKTEAIIEGGRSRLRPIVMTTLTTALGLFPLALGFGEGAEVRAPMAITVIGGLLVATLLTLIVIPVMYSILDRKEIKPVR